MSSHEVNNVANYALLQCKMKMKIRLCKKRTNIMSDVDVDVEVEVYFDVDKIFGPRRRRRTE